MEGTGNGEWGIFKRGKPLKAGILKSGNLYSKGIFKSGNL